MRHSSSGMKRKFMPYQPAISVSGMKMVVTTVSSVIVWFWRTSSCAL